MNAAQLDRFAVIKIDYLPEKAEKFVLKKTDSGLSGKQISQMVDLAQKTRQGDAAADLTFALGHRTMVRWASMASVVGFEMSYIVNVANKADNGTRQKLIELYQRIFGLNPVTGKA